MDLEEKYQARVSSIPKLSTPLNSESYPAYSYEQSNPQPSRLPYLEDSLSVK